jgi:hypothetical protein
MYFFIKISKSEIKVESTASRTVKKLKFFFDTGYQLDKERKIVTVATFKFPLCKISVCILNVEHIHIGESNPQKDNLKISVSYSMIYRHNANFLQFSLKFAIHQSL